MGFEYVCERIGENLDSVKKWYEGEKSWGLKNSLFVCEDGVLKQYVDYYEGEEFFNKVKFLKRDEFDRICEIYFEGLEEEDLAKIHYCLAVFDEMDSYNLGDDYMKRRLRRIRESTQDKPYKLKNHDSIRNFILYKGKVYIPDLTENGKKEEQQDK